MIADIEPLHEPLTLIVAFIVGVIATARLTRLIVDDDWPPVKKFREWYTLRLTKGGDWSELVTCPFCVSPYIAAPNLAIAWLSDLAWWWWAPNLWLAGMYLASMLNVRDIPSEE